MPGWGASAHRGAHKNGPREYQNGASSTVLLAGKTRAPTEAATCTDGGSAFAVSHLIRRPHSTSLLVVARGSLSCLP
jgi:hypothetical protein